MRGGYGRSRSFFFFVTFVPSFVIDSMIVLRKGK